MKFLLYIFVFQLLSNVLIPNSYIIMNISPNNNNQQMVNKTRRSVLTTLYRAQWDNGVIPYEIESVFSGSQRRIIKQAIREWEKSTCLAFVYRSQKQHPNYVKFSKKPCGCCSYAGNQRIGKQVTSFNDKCLTFGSVLHELGHIIGLLHEQSRPDRDKYLTINTNTISNNSIINFVKYHKSKVFVFGYYDYNSIMHYSSNFMNELNVIKPKNKINGTLPKIGQRSYLSKIDIAGINYFYNCPKCGSTFFANYGNFSPSSKPNDLSRDLKFCQWTIRAAQGERIKLDIKSLNIYNSTNCTVEFLEIRKGYQIDGPVIARYCGKVESSTIIASNYLIVTFNRTRSKDRDLDFFIQYEIYCGGDIYIEINKTYYFESPNYPEEYQPYKQCEWYVKAPYKHYLLIKFDYFEVEESEKCKNDFLEAREGRNDNAPLIGTYCGKAENLEIASLMRRVYLMFFSNGSKQAGGFSAAISAIPI